MALVDRLERMQDAAGFSDGQFAAMLGIPEGTWATTKSGDRQPRLAFIQAVLNAFDGNDAIEADVIEYLKVADFERRGKRKAVAA